MVGVIKPTKFRNSARLGVISPLAVSKGFGESRRSRWVSGGPRKRQDCVNWSILNPKLSRDRQTHKLPTAAPYRMSPPSSPRPAVTARTHASARARASCARVTFGGTRDAVATAARVALVACGAQAALGTRSASSSRRSASASPARRASDAARALEEARFALERRGSLRMAVAAGASGRTLSFGGASASINLARADDGALAGEEQPWGKASSGSLRREAALGERAAEACGHWVSGQWKPAARKQPLGKQAAEACGARQPMGKRAAEGSLVRA